MEINFNKVFIVAEMSANHGGNIEVALETVRAAKRSGADAIKLQTFTPDTITLESTKKDFLVNHGTLWDGRSLHDLYKEASLPWDWHEKIFRVALEEDLVCFSSPFDKTAVDFLEDLNCPIYKIASPEITDIPLIEYVAAKGKPIILSTGIATEEDIILALATIKRVGNNQIVLLKCTTSYPAPIEEANLIMIIDFEKKFNVIPGLSDHTLGITAPVVAAALGAKVIEKHFILDKSIGGPDASFSLNEVEFTAMVKAVREAEVAVGKVDYSLTEKQIKGREFSRSLYFVKDVKAGELISEENIRSVRPGYGLHPKHLMETLGKKVKRDAEKGTPVSWDILY